MAERELVRRVEAHTGRKIGPWEVTYALHICDKRAPIELLSTTEMPDRRVAMMGRSILDSDGSFAALIPRLAGYACKATRTIRGSEYDFVDFKVRVGMTFDKNNVPSGVAVEIE